MEIKVKCQCGSVYTFQDNVVDGRLEFPVSCSNCGADGTERANAFIHAKLTGAPDPFAEKPKKSLFGFFKKKESDADEAIPAAPLASAPNAAANQASQTAFDNGDETSALRLGIAAAGALAMGALGAIGWYLLTRATHYEFGFVAWALGGLVGLTSRILAPRGHAFLGVTAALAAIVAIGGGEYLVGRWLVKDVAVGMAAQETMEYAKKAVAAKSEDDFREVVSEYNLVSTMAPGKAGPLETFQQFQLSIAFPGTTLVEGREPMTIEQIGKVLDPEQVTPQQIEQFKAKVLPELKQFAEGKPSVKEYEATMASTMLSRMSIQDIYIFAMTPFSIFWLLLGIGSAFKIARNAGARY